MKYCLQGAGKHVLLGYGEAHNVGVGVVQIKLICTHISKDETNLSHIDQVIVKIAPQSKIYQSIP